MLRQAQHRDRSSPTSVGSTQRAATCLIHQSSSISPLMQRTISQLEKAISRQRVYSKMDRVEPTETIFPLLGAEVEQPGHGHASPVGAVLAGLHWAWLSTQSDAPIDELREGLSRVVRRAIEVNELAPPNHFRFHHDPMMMSAAILTDDGGLARDAAAHALVADGSMNRGNTYFAAWSGTLKFAVEGQT